MHKPSGHGPPGHRPPDDGPPDDGPPDDGLPDDGSCAPRGADPADASVVLAALDRVEGLVMELQGAALSSHTDAQAREGVAAVEGLRRRLDALYLHLLGDLDRRPEAVPGSGSRQVAATFLVHALNVSPRRAAHDVRAARALDPDGTGITPQAGEQADPTRPEGLPRLGSALARGQASLAHVDAVLSCLRRVPGGVLRAVSDADRLGDGPADGCPMSGMARVDAFLAEQAQQFSPDMLRRIGRQLAATLHPDGEDHYDPHALDRRRLDYAADADGMLVGSFALDPVAGARFRAVIDGLTRQQTPGSGADAVGEAPAGHDRPDAPLRDERTASQRRADALHQLCRDAMPPDVPGDAPADGASDGTSDGTPDAASGADMTAEQCAGPSADAPAQRRVPACRTGPTPPRGSTQVVVLGTIDQIAAAMAGGRPTWAGPRPSAEAGLAVDVADGPLDPGTLSMLLCSAVFHGVMLGADPPSEPSTDPPDRAGTGVGGASAPAVRGGVVLAQGRSRRLATAAQVRAVIARDRGCIVPGCALPPGRCEAHHVVWWRNGGATDVDNLALLCTIHHSAVHSGRWRIVMIDGLPWVVAPRWVDPQQVPRRNTVADAEHAARSLGGRLRGRRDGRAA